MSKHPPSLVELADRAGLELFDYQIEFLEDVSMMEDPKRACLYYKTGAGKSFTALAAMALWGYSTVTVIAPPATHSQWLALAVKLKMNITPMSHAKFRMKDTLLSRKMPVIADEMHLFGGQKGVGWRKLDKLAQHLEAPLILASATPNYNDAERVYCIQHILDPHSCKGGFLQFLYQHCETEQNPFGMQPKVLGFTKYSSAAEYLADLPNVYYLPDDLVITIDDIEYDPMLPTELLDFGYNRAKNRMIASIIEQMHTVRYQGLVAEDGLLNPYVYRELLPIVTANNPTLIYANHATVANVVMKTLSRAGLKATLVTGDTPKPVKEQIIQEFCQGSIPILIGTATLATGTDGMDKVCDTLVILDDTDDESLRRQLIGRIMPRGGSGSVASKQIFRLKPEFS